MTMTNGNIFDLLSLDLAAGVWTEVGDTTQVTGNLHSGGTLTTTIELDEPFATHALNWLDLDSVSFSTPIPSNAYIAYDNIVIRGQGVPEPAAWALMLGGLIASGYMLRRARQLAAVEA